jgi:trigger factor
VIPEAYNKALEDEDIDAIGQPQIEMVSAEPLSFKATVPIRPNIDLGDYTAVRVPREPVEVDEADVDASLEELRRRYAIQEPVERPVRIGDVIRGDVRIVVDDREVYKDEDAEMHLREGKTVLLPGFAEGVVGAHKGLPQEIEVTLPDDADSALAGKTGVVHITLKEVKEERLPEPDDEFAKGVGEGFASLADLKDRLRSDIRERQDVQAEESYRDAALVALVEQAGTIEFPPLLVEREIDRFLNDQARNTGMELDRYLELIKKTPEEVREELRPSATERVKRSLVLGQLADTEKIETTDADVEAEVQKLLAQASGGDDEQVERYRRIFQSPEARASLGRSLVSRRTIERLVEIASQADGAASVQSRAEASVKKKKVRARTPAGDIPDEAPQAELKEETS